ncbi:defensin-1 [Prorops nasuta]|uniref:defensin-1 n=1 Tax=Prorops nasuta TaxID=863751 RepID=UPI0034D009CF
MKIYVVAALLLVAVSAYALPIEEENADSYIPLDDLVVPQQEEVRADRQRRVTCDLLSWGGVVNDSACAANCLSMGKAGGRCINSVCTCRKTNIKDLWNKRFGKKH